MAGPSGTQFEPALTAADVARGVCRLFASAGLVAIPEVPLPNGRRTDLPDIDAKGQITIVEIEVRRADLQGAGKWPAYCTWSDRVSWELAAGRSAESRVGKGRGRTVR